jgi:hypothetical protein
MQYCPALPCTLSALAGSREGCVDVESCAVALLPQWMAWMTEHATQIRIVESPWMEEREEPSGGQGELLSSAPCQTRLLAAWNRRFFSDLKSS